jgi:hypothetical protein
MFRRCRADYGRATRVLAVALWGDRSASGWGAPSAGWCNGPLAPPWLRVCIIASPENVCRWPIPPLMVSSTQQQYALGCYALQPGRD